MEKTGSRRASMFHRLLMHFEPETAHELAMTSLHHVGTTAWGEQALRHWFAPEAPSSLRQDLLGRTFANPIGLAAGFDKNAVAIRGLAALGFGFLEVGTVTPLAQAGNPRPRVFRHSREASLQNALGFNNDGLDTIRRRVAAGFPYPVPIGVNVGKNATTPLESAERDYERLFRGFAGCADYFVVNISSPNTPGLRELQSPARVAGLIELGRELTNSPVLVKLSPDLADATALELVGTAVDSGAAGVILTNTTTDYARLPAAGRFGGLSGAVLRERSFELLRIVARDFFGKTVIVSVGGIDSGDEAYRRLRTGASLVQIYTAVVYGGPGLIGRAVGRVAELMARDGFDKIDRVIGADLKGQ